MENRLRILVESRIRRNVYVRFGGGFTETYRSNTTRRWVSILQNGYFNSILSSSSVITLQTDSIFLDVPRKYFRYYGKEKIDRRSSTVTRSLITEGNLVDIKRSDNNSNGVLITNWKTLENKDLENVPKTTF
jgi:hypothetical protein